jgi:hypothetical protein
MIFRLTHKLAKKVGIARLKFLPLNRNPFIDWTAHLFTADRVQYIIVTNTVALYSLIMHGRGVTDDNRLFQETLSYMAEFIKNDGYEFIFRRLIVLYTGRISFSKATDRRFLGSMNDLIFQAKYYLTEHQMSPFDASLQVNETPMSYLGYNIPKEAFKSLRVEIEETPSSGGGECSEE